MPEKHVRPQSLPATAGTASQVTFASDTPPTGRQTSGARPVSYASGSSGDLWQAQSAKPKASRGPMYGSTSSLPEGRSDGRKGLTDQPVYLDSKVMRQVRDNQSKFIQGRINNVEKHFGEFCQSFAAYVRKLSKLRDRGDEVSKALVTYAENESFNPTTKNALRDFAEGFSGVQDYRNTEVSRLENKVVGPLTLYGTECKHAKERLKQAFASRNKELKEKKNLDKIKGKDPTNRQHISQAESDLQKASVDASRASKHLEEEMDAFEKKKLTDVKKILMDFVSVELLFHSKALEMYTQCWHSVSTMSEEEDLEEFRNSLRPPSVQSRMGQIRSGSRNSLNTTGVSGMSTGQMTPTTTPKAKQRGAPTPTDTMVTTEMSATGTTNRSSMYSEDMDDYEDEEGEEEEEEEEEEESEEEESSYHPRRK